MTLDEKRKIDRRCAEALGWEVKEGSTGWRWFKDQVPVSDTHPTKGSAERHVTDFLAPNGAALLMAELMRRGCRVVRYDYKSELELPAYPSSHRAHVQQKLSHNGNAEHWWGTSDESEYIALALAFLAACEATETE